MTRDELQRILSGYKWIRVRRYKDDPTLSWEERYKRLEEHHRQETEFLIEMVRKLAVQVPLEDASEG